MHIIGTSIGAHLAETKTDGLQVARITGSVFVYANENIIAEI